jgi:hypothetical protein
MKGVIEKKKEAKLFHLKKLVSPETFGFHHVPPVLPTRVRFTESFGDLVALSVTDL